MTHFSSHRYGSGTIGHLNVYDMIIKNQASCENDALKDLKKKLLVVQYST